MKRYLLAITLFAGCTAAGTDDLGSVGLGVTTTGADGATYRLTPGTRLSLASTTGVPNYDAGLDGDGSAVTLAVSTGDYQAGIYHANGYTTEWPLERTLGGVTTVVEGELLTMQPMHVTVLTGQTTSIVLQFEVATGGTITFDRGSVDVSVDVNEQPATGFTAAADGTGNIAGTPLTTGPYTDAIAALLPAAGATGLHVAVGGHVTGPWTDVGGTIDPDGIALSVCAPFQLDTSSASGHAGLVALVAEANHGSAPSFLYGNSNICVSDDGTISHVRIRLSREGTAETQAFQDVLGTAPALFHIQVIGDLPTRVYNSQSGSFDLDALLGTQTLPLTVRLQLRDDNDLNTFWYSGHVTGSETFTLTGTAAAP